MFGIKTTSSLIHSFSNTSTSHKTLNGLRTEIHQLENRLDTARLSLQRISFRVSNINYLTSQLDLSGNNMVHLRSALSIDVDLENIERFETDLNQCKAQMKAIEEARPRYTWRPATNQSVKRSVRSVSESIQSLDRDLKRTKEKAQQNDLTMSWAAPQA